MVPSSFGPVELGGWLIDSVREPLVAFDRIHVRQFRHLSYSGRTFQEEMLLTRLLSLKSNNFLLYMLQLSWLDFIHKSHGKDCKA